MRLQKYISTSNFCSRRKAAIYIEEDKVKVNGIVISKPWYDVKDTDIVEVDGKILKQESYVYFAFNKPINVISSVNDDRGRKTVLDYYSGNKRSYPVGRLDYKSIGLILLTNDGKFSQILTHPRNKHTKSYHVTLNNPLSKKEIEFLRKPLYIDNYKINPVEINQIGKKKYEFILTEGRNRQIRNMIAFTKKRIVELKRVRISCIELGDLPEGKMRNLSEAEIKTILDSNLYAKDNLDRI